MSFDYEYIGSKYIKYQIYPNFTKFLQLLGIYNRRLSTRSVSDFLSLSKKLVYLIYLTILLFHFP